MITFAQLIQFVAVAFAVCGLAAVIWEIATKSPRSFGEIVTDVRGFAQRPLDRETQVEPGASSATAGPDPIPLPTRPDLPA